MATGNNFPFVKHVKTTYLNVMHSPFRGSNAILLPKALELSMTCIGYFLDGIKLRSSKRQFVALARMRIKSSYTELTV